MKHFHFMQIDGSTSQNEIDDTIDNPRYLALVNSSGWPTNRCITMLSKSAFVHGLTVQEFTKCIPLLKFFSKG